MTRSLNSVVEEIAQNDEMAKEFCHYGRDR